MNAASRLVFAGVLAGSTVAAASDGSIDTTFGNGGSARSGRTDVANRFNAGPIVQPDGKILVCDQVTDDGPSGSDFFVVRFDADGALDDTFSFDGSLAIDFDGGQGTDVCTAIALQSDGKILVAGYTSTTDATGEDFAVARINSDGTLDTTFGNGTGKTTIGFDLDSGSGSDEATAIVVQADGNIVVAGTAATAGGGFDFAVVRMLTDGTRDSSFNLTGKVNFGFNISGGLTELDEASSIAVDSDGRLIIGGMAIYEAVSEFAVARVLPNGQFDANFHANGRTTISFDLGSGTSEANSYGLLIDQDGKIVLVGAASSSPSGTGNADMAVARLMPDGSMDDGFGTGGEVLVPFDLTANGTDVALGVVEQSDRKLILGGLAGDSGTDLAAAVRLHDDGTLDASFGSLGKQTYDFGLNPTGGQAFRNVALQGTQIVAGGIAYVPGGVDMFVTRLNVDLIFANGFE
jgi:uncharacterized delta-60 repeat protein